VLDWRAEGTLDAHGGSSASVGVNGAIGYAQGRAFASRRIDDAFVVVEVGVPDLPVLLDNREVARTNGAGWAVVTEARALQANRIGVDIAALPLQYSMPRDSLSVVPALGAGAALVFELSDGGATLAVRDAQGRAPPPGARVRVSTQRTGTAVTSHGEVFLERSDRRARVEIDAPAGRCSFDYDPATPAESYRCDPP